MNEKNDDGTTSGEKSVKPDFGSPGDATYGLGRLAKLAADYGAALDEIRKALEQATTIVDGLNRGDIDVCVMTNAFADFSILTHQTLKAVGK